MKALTLTALLPLLLLSACGRTKLPPGSLEANTTPPPNATTPGVPATATPAAAGRVALAGAPNGNNPAIPVNKIAGHLQLALVTGNGVQLNGQISGLAPNTEFGFHVHQNGDCSADDFKSAGEHFNPDGVLHGAPTSVPHHLGDLPSVKSNDQGIATVNTLVAGATLADGGLHDVLGKALILHAKPDDYKTQPSGNSGDRIGCGVIEKLP